MSNHATLPCVACRATGTGYVIWGLFEQQLHIQAKKSANMQAWPCFATSVENVVTVQSVSNKEQTTHSNIAIRACEASDEATPLPEHWTI